MRQEFQRAKSVILEQHQRQASIMKMHIDMLCKENRSLTDVNAQILSDTVRYRGCWLAAEYRLDQLKDEIKSLDILGDPDLEPHAQIPVDNSSPLQSESKRPWLDSGDVFLDSDKENQELEVDTYCRAKRTRRF